MIKKFNKETKTYKLFKTLQAGERVTPAFAESKLGIKNLSAEVSRVREHGFAIYRKNRVAGNGVQVVEYVMGTPSQELVALGYKAKRLGITL
jgi:hypothetical protein